MLNNKESKNIKKKEPNKANETLPELPSPIIVREDGADLLLPEKHPWVHHLREHLKRHTDITITEEQRETIGRYMHGWSKEEKEGSPKYTLVTYRDAIRFIDGQKTELERCKSEYDEKLKGPTDRDERLGILNERNERLRELDADRYIVTLFCLNEGGDLVVYSLVGVSTKELYGPRETYVLDPSRKEEDKIARYISPVEFAEKNNLTIVTSVSDTAHGVTTGISTGYTRITRRK